MTIYRVELRPRAQRAWKKLGPDQQKQLKRRLDERRRNPHVPSARLHGMSGCYKIKLRSENLRAVYQVLDDRLVLLVLAIGRRDRGEAYESARAELRGMNERG